MHDFSEMNLKGMKNKLAKLIHIFINTYAYFNFMIKAIKYIVSFPKIAKCNFRNSLAACITE
jgi:hypothetical protein